MIAQSKTKYRNNIYHTAFDKLKEIIVYFTNLGKEKQRTLSPKSSPNCSPKRRKNKYKDELSVGKGNSEAFTKARERKRFESVADDMEEGDDVLSNTSNLERELNGVKVYLQVKRCAVVKIIYSAIQI